jgi:AcrR family transcriptional regulator
MAHNDSELTEQAAKFLADFESYSDIADMTFAARRILAAAAALFYRSGAPATSVRDLTKACGLTPGALYNHFESRDELLFVLVRSGHRKSSQAVLDALAIAGDDPREQLAGYVRAYTTLHLRYPAMAQLSHREYVHLSEPHLQEIEDSRLFMRQRLIEILRTGQGKGTFELISGLSAAGQATMVLDICSRTSEWFTPAEAAPEGLIERYVVAALRLVGAR